MAQSGIDEGPFVSGRGKARVFQPFAWTQTWTFPSWRIGKAVGCGGRNGLGVRLFHLHAPGRITLTLGGARLFSNAAGRNLFPKSKRRA